MCACGVISGRLRNANNGYFAGAAALCFTKDLAENTCGARMLVICAELTVLLFASTAEGCFQTLVN